MAGKLASRTQRERRATTRAELLAAAERLIAERGFDAASLGDIAAAAGVSKGAIYHHFPSKGELLLALLDAHFEERIEAAARIAAARGSEAPQRLVEEIPFDRSWNLLFLEFVVRAARDVGFREELRSRLARLRARSAEGIDRFLEREGVETELSGDELAVMVAALGNGLAIEGLLDPERSTDSIYSAALAVMLEGLVGRSRHE